MVFSYRTGNVYSQGATSDIFTNCGLEAYSQEPDAHRLFTILLN